MRWTHQCLRCGRSLLEGQLRTLTWDDSKTSSHKVYRKPDTVDHNSRLWCGPVVATVIQLDAHDRQQILVAQSRLLGKVL
jgi:hypothetical protein